MKRSIFWMPGLALAACSAPAAIENRPAKESAAAPIAQASSQPAPLPFKIDEKGELLDFSYSYPAEAAALPTLVKRLQDDLAKIRSEALGYARDDRASAQEMDRPFHGHYLHKEWAAAGSSVRLLSLTAQTDSFTGGAHGNSGFSALLWDPTSDREMSLQALFDGPTGLERESRPAYCEALAAERSERREGKALEGQFSECPQFSELVIAPADKDGDGKFDHFLFLAGPYVAGPYVEGAYEIAVPATPDLLEAIRSAYRSTFEAQPQ